MAGSLLGAYGVGKTHLAAAIAHEALARDGPVLFVIAPDLLDHLRATFGPDSTVSYDDRFALVRDAPLLILDDLGTESVTPWSAREALPAAQPPLQPAAVDRDHHNLKPTELDPRIYSRMCDPTCGQIISITSADYRRRERRSAEEARHGSYPPHR